MSTLLGTDDALRDAVRMRQARADLLSLALIDARNRTLGLFALLEGLALQPGAPPPWRLVGHAGWFQEYWIARNTQRGRGRRCEAGPTRLASIDPRADAWFGVGSRRSPIDAPSPDGVRSYLGATLEAGLDLLDKASDDDAGLYFFRLALLHEDRLAETLQTQALWVDLPPERWPQAPSLPAARGRRDALWFAAQRIDLGLGDSDLVTDHERGGPGESLPEFDIDAQAVSWQQFAEFAADGGYDEATWWHADGWAWLQASGRRAPRGVAQWAGGVVAQRQGRLQRLPGGQAAAPLSWYEADAWCRWAGRRLPSEAEWELAAQQGAGRGWVTGDVFEWVAPTARAYPGHVDGPARLDRLPAPLTQRVLRGGSLASAGRRRYAQARRFAAPQRDDGWFGFRSCAL